MSEWIQAQTLPTASTLLELPQRMFSSKENRESHLKDIKTDWESAL